MGTPLEKPLRLYRVQHANSFTHYTPHDGFVAKGSYCMDYSYWVNAEKVRRHLDWHDRSTEPSPFVSPFDSLDDARRRASLHRNRHDAAVSVFEIDTSQFIPCRLRIQSWGGIIDLNGFIHPSTSTMIFSVREMGFKFHIEYGVVQRSEWLALETVPPCLNPTHDSLGRYRKNIGSCREGGIGLYRNGNSSMTLRLTYLDKRQKTWADKAGRGQEGARSGLNDTI